MDAALRQGCYESKQIPTRVSILVLVDAALRPDCVDHKPELSRQVVSILVLVDAALRPECCSEWKEDIQVSILVLVDAAL